VPHDRDATTIEGSAVITVSVVIPCYNRAGTIAEAVQSVHAQSRTPLELIVIDDASTDDSAQIAERGGARVIRIATNAGNATARNVGARAATGDAIAWLDSDDYWDANHLSVVAGLLDRYPEAAAAASATRMVGSRSGVWYGRIPPGPPVDVIREAFADWLIPSMTAIVRRDALAAVGGFDDNERYAADFDLWLRLACKYLFVSSREVTGNWRWHSDQLSTNPERQWEATYRFRSRTLEQLAKEGRQALVAELSAMFLERYKEDLQSAWDKGQTSWLRTLVSLSSIVPDAPRALTRKWALRSRIPKDAIPLIRAARSLTGRDDPRGPNN
jgi:glycosyltransferase involved in cell wall biosynthesis